MQRGLYPGGLITKVEKPPASNQALAVLINLPWAYSYGREVVLISEGGGGGGSAYMGQYGAV